MTFFSNKREFLATVRSIDYKTARKRIQVSNLRTVKRNFHLVCYYYYHLNFKNIFLMSCLKTYTNFLQNRNIC